MAPQTEYIYGLLKNYPEQLFQIARLVTNLGQKFTVAGVFTEHDFDEDGAAAVLRTVDKAEYDSKPECFHNLRYQRMDFDYIKDEVITERKFFGMRGDGIRSGPVILTCGNAPPQ